MAASSSAMQSSKGVACQTFCEISIVAFRKKKLWLFIIYCREIIISHPLTDLDIDHSITDIHSNSYAT